MKTIKAHIIGILLTAVVLQMGTTAVSFSDPVTSVPFSETIVDYHIDQINPPPPSINTGELQCLTEVTYQEAGSEPELGRIAVAFVVKNRVHSHRFPDSFCGVVHQVTNHHGHRLCQFSWVCNAKKAKIYVDYWTKCADIAKLVLTDQITSDPTHGALYFHNNHVRLLAANNYTAHIGHHYFYTRDHA